MLAVQRTKPCSVGSAPAALAGSAMAPRRACGMATAPAAPAILSEQMRQRWSPALECSDSDTPLHKTSLLRHGPFGVPPAEDMHIVSHALAAQPAVCQTSLRLGPAVPRS